jgi:hypothetical protein
MEFVSCGHYWLTPSAKKRKKPSNSVDSSDLFDLTAVGVKHTPEGHHPITPLPHHPNLSKFF